MLPRSGRWSRWLAVMALLAACAPQEYRADTPSRYLTAAGCLQSNQDRLYARGIYAGTYLTVGTEDPAVSPWWAGGTTREHPEWEPNDPYLGRGYEGALTAELVERLGVPRDHVRFVPVTPDGSLAPGPKPFDFAIDQLPYVPALADDVDFSDGYYDVRHALVSVRGSRVSGAVSVRDVTEATVGAVGATSLRYVQDALRNEDPPVFGDVAGAASALRDRRVDGLVVDLPTAMRFVQALGRGTTIVRTLPPVAGPDHFAMSFEEGSPFVECVNLALDEIAADGTLERLRLRWLGREPDLPSISG